MRNGRMLLLLLAATTACTRVDVGHAGIVVHRYGSNRGVDAYPLVTGTVFYNPFTTSVMEYPTFMQIARWTAGDPNEEIQFNSSEGLIIHADISLGYQLDPTRVPHFYVKFRSDDIGSFTHGYLRNIARDAFAEVASRYTAEEIYGPKKEQFLREVRERVNGAVDSIGVEIQQFGFIGAPRLPENVVQALNSKIQAIQDAQRAQNQVAIAQAQALSAVAKAEGEAKANQALATSITPNLLEWRRLDLQQQAIGKWSGALPQLMGGALPFLQVQPENH